MSNVDVGWAHDVLRLTVPGRDRLLTYFRFSSGQWMKDGGNGFSHLVDQFSDVPSLLNAIVEMKDNGTH